MIELNPESEQTFGVHIVGRVIIELLPREILGIVGLLMLKCYRNQLSTTNTVTE